MRLDELRSGLERALQETDHNRELDSLENTTALAYLVGQGHQAGSQPADQAPKTIGGWLAWVAHSSPDS